jgi:hemerythrin
VENFFQWRSGWLLGIKGIDEQHRKLVDGVNKLAPLYMSAIRIPVDKGALRARLIGLLNLLHADLEQHFHDEEQLMMASDYPGYKSHVHAHIMFLAEFKNYSDCITSRDEALDMETLYALRTWFIMHFLDDREFASHLHAARVAGCTERQVCQGE